MPSGVPKAGFRTYKAARYMVVQHRNNNRLNGVVQNVSDAVANTDVRIDNRSDDAIAADIEGRFVILSAIAAQAVAGKIRSVIVSGPAGLGKSWTVEQHLHNGGCNGPIKGFTRATGVYRALVENQHEGCVATFDDCDDALFDATSLNLFKSALDTTNVRTVSWNSETKMEDADGEKLPRSIQFKGTVIFITNIDFDEKIRSGHHLSKHFEALISRSHYIELGIHSPREYLIRINQVIDQGMLLDKGHSEQVNSEIREYINDNSEHLRELTLRMALKLANLRQIYGPTDWKTVAKVTCMRYNNRG